MNRDLVLSALAAAALHGGLFFGYSPKKPAPVTRAPDTIMLDDGKFLLEKEPPEVADVDTSTEKPESSREEIVPRQVDRPTIAKPNDFTRPFVPTPAVDGPPLDRIPKDFGNSPGIKRDVIFRASDLDRPPRTRAQVSPVYPFEAKRNGMTGTVQVEFSVDENGRVSDPRIVESTDTVFNDATLQAVLKWRFEPGTREGKKVRFRMMAPVVFNLKE